MRKEELLSLERLRQLVHYDPDTGIFTAVSGRGGVRAGDQLGCKDKRSHSSYIFLSLDGRNYRAHRVAWFFVTGHWPVLLMDHINGDGTDNRIVNLREATHLQNSANRRPNKDRVLKGIAIHTRKKRWQAQIRNRGLQIYLGLFDTPESAAAAYAAKATELQGHFAWISPTRPQQSFQDSDGGGEPDAANAAAASGSLLITPDDLSIPQCLRRA
jgi:hypothetical protein